MMVVAVTSGGETQAPTLRGGSTIPVQVRLLAGGAVGAVVSRDVGAVVGCCVGAVDGRIVGAVVRPGGAVVRSPVVRTGLLGWLVAVVMVGAAVGVGNVVVVGSIVVLGVGVAVGGDNDDTDVSVTVTVAGGVRPGD